MALLYFFIRSSVIMLLRGFQMAHRLKDGGNILFLARCQVLPLEWTILININII